ncbi:ribosome small subunit-dependent GTPase A [Virgibacillus halophilus]|uniref:ribosome small subunit-dependent GTPase A n=1 Tax=Tigheibacillus halophilus TaxID=361280 RepID=UPI003628EC72
MKEGRIIKALSGFYYVKADDVVYPCKGRGLFRKQKITPLVGDFVTFDEHEAYITDIAKRTNELVRPPISNITQAILVSSATMPDFSSLLLDRFLVLIEAKQIKPIIVITKVDRTTEAELAHLGDIQQQYRNIGYQVILFSAKGERDPEALKPYFKDQVTVIAGQSGVGKTSLLNALEPSLLLKTADISKSLGRGKHTTRHVELLEIANGLIADTPGFSMLEFGDISAEVLADSFPEFEEHQSSCKFRGCLHYKEPKCAVKEAVATGKIATFRYEHYISFLEEIQSRKPRY